MLVALPADRAFDPAAGRGADRLLALASRVRLYLGAGSAMPTQLVLVPMLFLLPPATVPACVAARAGRRRLDRRRARGRAHPERMLTGTADAWHAVGAEPRVRRRRRAAAPTSSTGPSSSLALLAQSATDLLAATAREWLGRGIAPMALLRVIVTVYLIDACLTPVGLLIAIAVRRRMPSRFLLVLPLLALLAALAYDRRRRIHDAVGRLDELTAEHVRLDRRDPPDRRGVRLQARPRRARRHRAAHRGRGARRRSSGAPRSRRARSSTPSQRRRGAWRPPRRGGATRRSAARAPEKSRVGDGAAADRQRPGVDRGARRRARAEPFTRRRAGAVRLPRPADRASRSRTSRCTTGCAARRPSTSSPACPTTAGSTRCSRTRSTACAAPGRSTALALIDLDDFKTINDTHGHRARRRVLRAVADVIGARLPRHRRARALRRRRARRDPPRDRPRRARTVGEASAARSSTRAPAARRTRRHHGQRRRERAGARRGDPAALIEAADVALHDAKRAGKNRDPRRCWARLGAAAPLRPRSRSAAPVAGRSDVVATFGAPHGCGRRLPGPRVRAARVRAPQARRSRSARGPRWPPTASAGGSRASPGPRWSRSRRRSASPSRAGHRRRRVRRRRAARRVHRRPGDGAGVAAAPARRARASAPAGRVARLGRRAPRCSPSRSPRSRCCRGASRAPRSGWRPGSPSRCSGWPRSRSSCSRSRARSACCGSRSTRGERSRSRTRGRRSAGAPRSPGASVTSCGRAGSGSPCSAPRAAACAARSSRPSPRSAATRACAAHVRRGPRRGRVGRRRRPGQPVRRRARRRRHRARQGHVQHRRAARVGARRRRAPARGGQCLSAQRPARGGHVAPRLPVARVGRGDGRWPGAGTVAGLVAPGDAEAYHFCGHIYTTDSCPHPTGLPRIDSPRPPAAGARTATRSTTSAGWSTRDGRAGRRGRAPAHRRRRPAAADRHAARAVCDVVAAELRHHDAGRRRLVPLLRRPRPQARRLLLAQPPPHQRRRLADRLLLQGPQGLLRHVLRHEDQVLETVLVLAAAAAGVTGAWSPCGFSMVETLAPRRLRRAPADDARGVR